MIELLVIIILIILWLLFGWLLLGRPPLFYFYRSRPRSKNTIKSSPEPLTPKISEQRDPNYYTDAHQPPAYRVITTGSRPQKPELLPPTISEQRDPNFYTKAHQSTAYRVNAAGSQPQKKDVITRQDTPLDVVELLSLFQDTSWHQVKSTLFEREGGGSVDFDQQNQSVHTQINANTVTINQGRPSNTVTRAGIPFQAPALPGHLVPRPEISESLKEWLISIVDGPNTLVVSAIYGLGGIGKTTIAASLAHDPEIQQQFPDGILWATLGQHPDVLSWLNSHIQSLGDYDFRPTTIQTAASHFRTLVRNRKILIVVDDAWDSGDVRPFLVANSSCRVIVTTRDALIARAISATLYDMDVMSVQQSIALIEGKIRRHLSDSESVQAVDLCKIVGFLPLAIELAAAQVEGGIPWKKLIEDLGSEIAHLESLEFPGVESIEESERRNLSLRASFSLSLRRLTEAHLHRIAWLGVISEDVNISPKMAMTIWNTDEKQAIDTLRLFKDKSLLLQGVSHLGDRSYKLHDLVHDTALNLLTGSQEIQKSYQVSGLGLSLSEAHSGLLENYSRRATNYQWHTLPDDGYIHTYLAWHIEKSNHHELIHDMLCEETDDGTNGWYQVKLRLGQMTGYVADVERAWSLADRAIQQKVLSRSQKESGNSNSFVPSPTLPISSEIMSQMRYALIISSINSLAKNIYPTLVPTLVERDIWPYAQASAYVERMPDIKQRSQALLMLSVKLMQMGRTREALSTVQRIDNAIYFVEAVEKTYTEMSFREIVDILQTAELLTDETSKDTVRSCAAVRLAQLGFADEAIATLSQIKLTNVRLKTMLGISSNMPIDSVRDFVAFALDLRDTLLVIEFVTELLAGKHDNMDLDSIILKLESQALMLSDVDQRCRALIRLIPVLSVNKQQIYQQMVLSEIDHVYPEKSRDITLSLFVQQLIKMKHYNTALDVLRMIRGEQRRKNFTATCFASFPINMIGELLTFADQFTVQFFKEEYLALLMPRLIEISTPEVMLDMIQKISFLDVRAKALLRILPFMPNKLLEEKIIAYILGILGKTQSESYKYSIIIEMSSYFNRIDEDIQKNLLQIIYGMKNERRRTNGLFIIIPHLSTPLVRDLLESIQRVGDGEYCLRILGTERTVASSSNADILADQEFIRKNAPQMIPLITDGQYRQVVDLALTIPLNLEHKSGENAAEDKRNATLLLQSIVRVLAFSGDSEGAIKVSKLLKSKPAQTRLLSQIAPHLPEVLVRKILSSYPRSIRSDMAGPISELTIRLAEFGAFEDARGIVSRISDDTIRATTLLRMGLMQTNELQKEYLSEIIDILSKTSQADRKAVLLDSLSPHLANYPLHLVIPIWIDILHSFSQYSRRDLLPSLQGAMPLVIATCGDNGRNAVTTLMKTILQWFP